MLIATVLLLALSALGGIQIWGGPAHLRPTCLRRNAAESHRDDVDALIRSQQALYRNDGAGNKVR